ncbi:phosphoribosylanthranilate isomerase [Brevibacillus fulvus]|uniref:N-(5'-phosphoribosyl)anthranilate isomerase n=1 Tax=Brevibacillus fulvus TaxID=1125967 RepID=A0A939BTR0_9BACL|nr:phosphoribosylanthranilate isomerase [Brevibacillus fulvus]MBM7588721.1 phosphoribosylanthranilate isomerase [Brevibacillus fulvus]
MTKVKICGIKNEQTLRQLTERKADYIGFVFAESRRKLFPEEAGRLLAAVPGHPPAVGVFVNPTIDALEDTLRLADLQVIQLHGQETAAFCQEVKERFGLPIWKAIPVAALGKLQLDLEAYKPTVEAFLFDTHDAALAGGTGKRFAWEQIPRLKELVGASHQAIIAGGINLDNVRELLDKYAPELIDVSSGVETDGVKDSEKIEQFMQRVKQDVHI